MTSAPLTNHTAKRTPVCRYAVAAVSAAALLALSACSSDSKDSDGNGSATTAPASPTADRAEEQARGAVLAAWRGMRAEQRKAYAVGQASKTDLKRFASDKALAKIEGELFQYRQAGVIFKGKADSSVKVTAINVDQSPHKATLKECFDTTHWKAVLKDSGKDVTTKNQVRRYTVTGTARTIGKRWMVVDFDVDKGRPC
ncbi:hypothetical protein [Streptomyces antimycoticus]